MNRRQFLLTLAAGAAAAIAPTRAFAADPQTGNVLRLHPDTVTARVRDSFPGLSYEANQLDHSDMFTPSNTTLIEYFRRLSRRGVLRIGGNSSEFTVWNPGPGADLSDIPLPFNTTKNHRRTKVTPESIDHLAAFLDAVDWSLIYGLNIGMGTPDQAAEEAAYVIKAVGRRLQYLQIGNEPDLFHHNGLRADDYKFDDFYKEWSTFADAVLAKSPGAPLAGPDVAGNVDWIREFSERAHNRIGLLTGHYYAEGPPSNPSMTIERLLTNHSYLDSYIGKLREASHAAGLPFRMAETNSCYSGGKVGVSDTFASSLWAADYTLQLASAGVVGVNFHGGGSGPYTPIAGDVSNGFSARPVYYGLMIAGQFAGADLVAVDFDPGSVNATTYAAKRHDGLVVAIVNKDANQSISVDLDPGMRVRDGRLWRLTAPAIDAKDGVTLAGAAVASTGTWSPSNEEKVDIHRIDVPASSAALVFLR